MKLKIETVFRISLVIMCGCLAWSIWAMAQSNNAPGARSAQTGLAKSNAGAARAGASARPAALEKEVWLTFGLDRIDALQGSILGNPFWHYLASIIYILLAICAAKLLDSFIGARLKQWAAASKTQFDDLLLDLVRGPIKVVTFVILIHIGLQGLNWPQWLENWLTKGLLLVVAGSLTYMALRFVDLLMDYWKQREAAKEDKLLDQQLFPVARKSLKIFVLIVAVLVTSQNLGLNITSVIASLSIGGLALGLAAQDTLANLFGAVAVFVDKPFRIGDRIKLDSVDGVVESIGLRSTRLRNMDGHLIAIPNKTMGNATVTNITRRPNIKTEMNLGISYDTPTDKVKLALAILEEIYRKQPMTHDLIVSFNKFSDSALNIQIVHWWGSTDFKAYVAGMQECNLAIKKRFDEAGIAFSSPAQTFYLQAAPDPKSGPALPPPQRR